MHMLKINCLFVSPAIVSFMCPYQLQCSRVLPPKIIELVTCLRYKTELLTNIINKWVTDTRTMSCSAECMKNCPRSHVSEVTELMLPTCQTYTSSCQQTNKLKVNIIKQQLQNDFQSLFTICAVPYLTKKTSRSTNFCYSGAQLNSKIAIKLSVLYLMSAPCRIFLELQIFWFG